MVSSYGVTTGDTIELCWPVHHRPLSCLAGSCPCGFLVTPGASLGSTVSLHRRFMTSPSNTFELRFTLPRYGSRTAHPSSRRLLGSFWMIGSILRTCSNDDTSRSMEVLVAFYVTREMLNPATTCSGNAASAQIAVRLLIHPSTLTSGRHDYPG